MKPPTIRNMDDVRKAFAQVWAFTTSGDPLVRLNQLTHPFVRSATRSLTSDTSGGMQSTTGTVSTASSPAPVSGQVLTATSPTTATWQTTTTFARHFLLMGA